MLKNKQKEHLQREISNLKAERESFESLGRQFDTTLAKKNWRIEKLEKEKLNLSNTVKVKLA